MTKKENKMETTESLSPAKEAEIEQILKMLSDIQQAVQNTYAWTSVVVRRAWELGALLEQVKIRCRHGEWQDWLKNNVPHLSYSTANRYLKLRQKFPNVEDLPESASLSQCMRLNPGEPDGHPEEHVRRKTDKALPETPEAFFRPVTKKLQKVQQWIREGKMEATTWDPQKLQQLRKQFEDTFDQLEAKLCDHKSASAVPALPADTEKAED